MATKRLVIFSLFLCLICSNISICSSINDPDEEDPRIQVQREFEKQMELGFSRKLELSRHYQRFDTKFEVLDDLIEDSDADSYTAPEVDETHVVVLKQSNFSEFVEKNRFVMVVFYAPWCGHCEALAPEYAAAATELKDDAVALAKVESTEEAELGQKFSVEAFPTIFFFIDGVHKPYPGERNKDAIVTWLRKKINARLHNVTTTEDAERILAEERRIVLGYLESLVGSESEELAAASNIEDDVSFYQTTSADVARLFDIDTSAKRPALVVVKKQVEKVTHFGGQFNRVAIAEFVFENKLPLITNFTRALAPLVFAYPIKRQLMLFATSRDAEETYAIFLEAAKAFKGKLVCVYVELDSEDGKSVSEHFGVTGDASTVLAYTGNDDARKFILDGDLTINNIKSFGEKFLADNLKPFYKSDAIPEENDGYIKIVVGNNFDEIVLDESKDVLLEIYDPGCRYCQSLEPTYNKLGEKLSHIDSLVIAKMDGTLNEHPRAKPDGFPTILFFPAGNKSFDPITFDDERTLLRFYKFLKKHASIPFKLHKPASTEKRAANSASSESHEISYYDVKDEL